MITTEATMKTAAAATTMDSGDSLERLTEVFRALSDKTRLNILLLLRDGEKNVSNLCELLNLPQPTVSHHLGLLRMTQLVENRRAGKQIYYGLSNQFAPAADAGAMTLAANEFQVTLATGPIGSAMASA